MICPKCGFKNGDVKFCENCGNNLNMNVYQNEDNITKNMNVEKSKKQKRIFNKKIIFFVLILIIIIFALLFIFNKSDKYIDDDEIPNDELMADIIFDENGIPKFIDGTFTERIVKDSESVLLALDDIKDLMKINDVNKEFEVLNVSNSENITFYKLQQKYNGIDVYGEQLIIAVDNDGNVLSLSGEYIPNITVDSKNELNDEEIMDKLIAKYGADIEIISKEKVIYVSDSINFVAYDTTVSTKTNILKIIIDATTGDFLNKYSVVNSEKYDFTSVGIDGKTYTVNINKEQKLFGDEYTMYDPVRNIYINDASAISKDFGNINDIKYANLISFLLYTNKKDRVIKLKMSDGVLKYDDIYDDNTLQNAIVAMNTFSKTYDYYKNILGRNSYDNNGAPIYVNIGVRNKSILDTLGGSDSGLWENACWMGDDFSSFFIGGKSGVTYSLSVDVSAHEFTHAVIEHTAGLIYDKESGALNESYADIMGNLIEGNNFTIGEDLETIRDMANPNLYSDPSVRDGLYYFPTDEKTYDSNWRQEMLKRQEDKGSPLDDWKEWDNGGVHTNSGVPNYAAYLMYQNGAFKDREEMAKVWYNSLMFLNSSAKFEDCAYAVLKSAKLLGLSQESLLIIEQAFVDTNMLEQKYFVFSGHVTDEQGNDLRGVKVTAVNKKNSSAIYTTYTTEDGSYTFNKLPKGDYDISYSKSRYSSEDKEVSLLKDSVLDLSLSKIDDSDISKAYCNPKKEICVIVTMYQISADSNGNMGETADKFYYKKGKKLDDMGLFNSDGYYDLGEFADLVKPGWYYRGTDKVYNWDEPVNEDLELEMKIAGLGNQDIIDFSNIFNH